MQDTYNRSITYLRISVTDLCNQRCLYCMPEAGVSKRPMAEMLTEDEMIRAVRVAAGLGVTKLRITGGEPLIKPNILSICERAAAVKGIKECCITTNGVRLAELARPLRAVGVNRVNISLDTLQADKFAAITRRHYYQDVLAGIEAALQTGFDKIKLNCVLIGGFNDDEITDFVALTTKYPLDVRFIELMPMYDSGDFGEAAYVPVSLVTERVPDLVPLESNGGVARRYKLPKALGEVGLISPLSNHFCGTCNRIRLTADGKLKPCLHSPIEIPIKGLDEVAMERAFREAIVQKPAQHPLLSNTCRSEAGRNMNQIGG